MKRFLKFTRNYPVGDVAGTVHAEGAIIEVDNEASFERWMRRNCCVEVDGPAAEIRLEESATGGADFIAHEAKKRGRKAQSAEESD